MMTSQFDLSNLTDRELADYGFARVRDAAFDAVTALWRKRQAAGMQQKDLAHAIGRDTGWVSRSLRGPGNWTMRTFGELLEGLQGVAEISVRPIEDYQRGSNFDAYIGYTANPNNPLVQASTKATGAAVTLRQQVAGVRVY